ncbi:MAG: hypothetical protein MJ060_02115 [Clostridia bacterium]|nr:hypothetical protein [Clostridia bacterium]
MDFIYSWFKRIRKYGGLVCFIIQNLGDIFGNQEIISKTTAITNNSQYSFIFQLAPADIESFNDIERIRDSDNKISNDEETQEKILKSLVFKRDDVVPERCRKSFNYLRIYVVQFGYNCMKEPKVNNAYAIVER